jgi:hypothetical protein
MPTLRFLLSSVSCLAVHIFPLTVQLSGKIMLVLSTVGHNYLVVDLCYLLHKYQLHVSALMAIFRLNELTKKPRQLYLVCVLYTVEGWIY